jgi:hypothetical protein
LAFGVCGLDSLWISLLFRLRHRARAKAIASGLDCLSFRAGPHGIRIRSGDSSCDGPMVSEAPTGGCSQVFVLLWLCRRARRSEMVRSWRREGMIIMIYILEASGRSWSRDDGFGFLWDV